MEKLLIRAGLLVGVVTEDVVVPVGESRWPRELLACAAMIADGGVTYAERQWWRVWRDATHVVAVPATAEVVCLRIRDAMEAPGAANPTQVRLSLVHGLPWSAGRDVL